MTDKEQPQPPDLFDVATEQNLLGACILNPETVFEYPNVRALVVTDFWNKTHQRVWMQLNHMRREGQEIDPMTVAAQLRKTDMATGGNGKLPDVGELTSWMDGSYSLADTHADLVRDYARRRFTNTVILNNLGRAIYSENGGFGEALAEAGREIQELQGETGHGLGWEVKTLADAYADRAPLEYVVDGLLSFGSLTIVYGQPGGLKTMLVQDLAVCVAAGVPWLSPLADREPGKTWPTTCTPVLWIDYDNGERRTEDRIEALSRARGIDPERTAFYYVSLPHPWLDASNTGMVNGLVRLVNDLQPGLVCIDNLGLVSGGADENSPEMIQVMSSFRRVAEETDAAVVLIHHERKGTGQNPKGAESLRGHSSITASLDLALLVERERGDASQVKVTGTKTRDLTVPTFGAVFAYEHKRGTHQLSKARFYGVHVDDGKSDAAVKHAIREAIKEGNGESKGKLTAAAHEKLDNVGINTIAAKVDALVALGDLEVNCGGPTGTTKSYSLTVVSRSTSET